MQFNFGIFKCKKYKAVTFYQSVKLYSKIRYSPTHQRNKSSKIFSIGYQINLILHIMEVDINKTKSRSYNYFLRNFHMGLRILAVIFSTHIMKSQQSCPQMFNKLFLPLTILLVILNLCFMVYFLCKRNFPRYEFFIFMSINVVICSVIGLLTYSYQDDAPMCRKNMIEQRYIFCQIIFNIPICLLILLAKFQWAQRYTNSPGNLTWTIVIISFSQDMSFLVQVQIVTWITALISVGTLLLNAISLVTGITQNMKRAILVGWVLGLVLTVVCILVMLMVFFNNYSLPKYADQVLSDICLKFILVGIIDVGFWIWGLLTLSYENGDFVRNAILYSNYDAYSKDQKQHQVEHNNDARGHSSLEQNPQTTLT